MTRSLAPHKTLSGFYDRDGERQRWVNQLFDRNAPHYDIVGRTMSLGTGAWYRRRVLRRAGVVPGAKILDVATGTGSIARACLELGVAARDVTGIDPSLGMLLENKKRLAIGLVRGVGERLPFADASFDFVVMGYALRHLPDLVQAFTEFHRVLTTGGKAVILEITRPRTAPARFLAKNWLARLVPAIARLQGCEPTEMMRFYWTTIDACVPPAAILATLTDVGFAGVHHDVSLGIFSDYRATKP